MKKLFLLSAIFLVFSCSAKNADNPLIIPPNFAEMPDLNNPEKTEKPTTTQQEENVAKLRELLLKSEE